jgi:uncharacterized membrane protein
MKLWVLYILSCFMVGVLVWRKPGGTRIKILIGLGLFVCFGYFFLNQI